jgi:hypothetical protein
VDEQSYETQGPPPRALIRSAWQEVGDHLAARQPGSHPSEGYLRGTLRSLEWALGMTPRTGPLTGTATDEQPTITHLKREAEHAYDEMHRLGPGAATFQFIVGVENTTMWLATGRGLYL